MDVLPQQRLCCFALLRSPPKLQPYLSSKLAPRMAIASSVGRIPKLQQSLFSSCDRRPKPQNPNYPQLSSSDLN
ncbi:hypothetical protein VNO77_39108 [Canavalia gladiata]|uniref:Uncharacterized protein n=1 Tax=Canavalia gladiata TaxID=3824 RepID=A0AAN9KCT5_CANGL